MTIQDQALKAVLDMKLKTQQKVSKTEIAFSGDLILRKKQIIGYTIQKKAVIIYTKSPNFRGIWTLHDSGKIIIERERI